MAVAAVDPAHGAMCDPAYLWKGIIPYPPSSLRYAVGAPTLENFLVVGDAWNQVLSRHISPQASVLDIGCGCGRTARFLAVNPHVRRYVGFDVIPENIAWNRRFIAPLAAGHFEFLHFDIFSAEYNPGGSIKASEFRFPAPDRSVNVAFAASLFTHVLEPDAARYLSEVSRVLAPDGIAVLSIHDATTAEAPYVGTETRVDVYPPYWLRLAARNGLALREHLGDLCGQDTYLLGVKS